MAMPFYGKEFTFEQPDGTEVRLKGWGDQHHAVFETLDGFTVVPDPDTGLLHYAAPTPDGRALAPIGGPLHAAEPSALGVRAGARVARGAAMDAVITGFEALTVKRRCEVRRERAKAMLRTRLTALGATLAPPSRETTGSYVGLCLLIQFPSVSGTITPSQVTAFCNQSGYSDYGNNGSVRDYFLDVSAGKFDYTNLVTPYYTAAQPRPYYTDPKVQYGDRARELISEALTALKSQGFDFTPLSCDDEGYVYAVNAFYAGKCPNFWGQGLWPHSSSLTSPLELAPGMLAYDYQITNIGSDLSLATFCHENGHMVCDFPDLYDYGYESQGAGRFCLMGYGGADAKNPSQVGAYLKYASGWATKVTTVADGQVELPASQGNEFLIHRHNAYEYFIMENRVQEGRDASLPDAGLAIWHVDELGRNDYEQQTQDLHYESALEQADGRFHLETNPGSGGNTGDAHDLFSSGDGDLFAPGTTPSSGWWDGSPSGLAVATTGTPGSPIGLKVSLGAAG